MGLVAHSPAFFEKMFARCTYRELMDAQTTLERVIAAKHSEEMLKIREEMTKLAGKHGVTLLEVLNDRPSRKKVAIKFRDPKNPENTWTGRGRMPRWMVKAGKNKEAFAI